MLAAKKYKNRIYLKSSLDLNSTVQLSEYHFNYLIKVLRLKAGDEICVFNELGQWLAQIQDVSKREAYIKIYEFLNAAPKHDARLTLLFAPVKNPNASFYVQKATELGVDAIIPILTKRTIVRTLKSDKLEQVAIEAAEQCERFSVPQILPMMGIMDIEKLELGRIFFCDERGGAAGILDAIAKHKTNNDAVLIGPEGGFDEEERSYLLSLPNVVPVSLGDNILRAETAMIAALAAYLFT